MKTLNMSEAAKVIGGRQKVPGACSVQRMVGAIGFGALAGIPGFAGGPIVGASTVLFGGSVGGMSALWNCAQELRGN
ncbi:hypothetical protein [Luteibacter sp. 9133]|uniref:hypothetical protein n=1 Tax=Luteibacter sp. 9133 TaxID=1500891 RepID=UPI0012E00D00|nr:hypothetical protein [Luteibacter sp. 9133]